MAVQTAQDVKPPAERRRRGPRQDNRRDSLLDAAARLFAARGFHAVTMREIAADAGMLAGSVYYHFKSKDDLLIEVYEQGVRLLCAQVDRAAADIAEPWRRLEAACRAHSEMLLEDSDYAQVILRVFPDDVPPERDRLATLRAGYEDRFRAMIETLALPAGVNRSALRFTLLGALNWAKSWYRPGGMTPADISAEIIKLLKRQLAEEDAGR
jgi:AcrR family transcriptional regulator